MILNKHRNGGVILLPTGDDVLDRLYFVDSYFQYLSTLSLHGKFGGTTSKRSCPYTLSDEHDRK